MSFKLLKKIISHLRRTEICPFCSRHFSEDMIFVLATSTHPAGDGCLGFFLIMCETCHASALVAVEVTKKLTRKEFIRVMSKSAHKKISMDEVLDMHNFLKQYEGDLNGLFHEK